MKIYDVTIEYYDGDELQTMGTAIVKLETPEEDALSNRCDETGDYEELLGGTGYSDDDIYFYFMSDEEDVVEGLEYSTPDDCDYFKVTKIYA